MANVCVVGGGPAGMMAAYQAAMNGHTVTLFEKNDRLGRKLLMTGNGRCNVTNDATREEFFQSIVSNPKFLLSAFGKFNNFDMMYFLEEQGIQTYVQEDGRVFPQSNQSRDIIYMWQKLLNKVGVTLKMNHPVVSLIIEDEVCKGVSLRDGSVFLVDTTIVATGGISYPMTGCTGDGYLFAQETGHSIIEPRFGLVSFETKERYDLQGLALQDVRIKLGKLEQKGDLLFTHYGVSGPVILNMSSKMKDEFPVLLSIDIKPDWNEKEFDQALLKAIQTAPKKQVQHILTDIVASRLATVILAKCGISYKKKAGELTKADRKKIIEFSKKFDLHIVGNRGQNEAMVTQGGISIKDIQPNTMESKRVQNLKFCGEVLDVDGLTGGFNLQIAWSTGYLAGSTVTGD